MTNGRRFLEHLAAAIAIATVADDQEPTSSHQALARLHMFLEATYPGVWSELEVEHVGGHSLLMTWPGDDRSLDPLILMAHLDVVPVEAGSEALWSRPPFAGDRTESHLIGRGAIDDKGSLIAILEAVETLAADAFTPRRTVMLAFGHDEETMGSQGAASIAELLQTRGVHAELVLDEGGFVTEGVVPGTMQPVALVGVSEKGYLDVEISAVGVPGHSSAPPRVTAIGAVARAVASLEDSPMPARLDVQAPFFTAASSAARPGLRRLIRRLPRLGPLATRLLDRRPSTAALIRTTVAPTVISGGVKSNVLAATARAIVNFRLLPGDTVDSVLEHIDDVTKGDVAVEMLRGWNPSPVSDTASLGYVELSSAIRQVFPSAVVAPWVVIGATDSRYFTGLAPTVLRFVPFRMDADELTGFHGADERIRLTDAEPAVEFYRTLIERMAG